MRTATAAALAASLLLIGCARPDDKPAVPQITVAGEPDSTRSLAPDEVLGARQAAGIEACPRSDLDAEPVDGGLPALVLDCLGKDTKVNLAGLPVGKPRVVNLWAHWCQPCTDEAPAMAEVWKQSKGKVDFLGINWNDPFAGRAVDFIIRTDTRYAHVVDPKMTGRAPLKVAAVPQTWFVDAQGRVVHRDTKVYHSADELRADVKTYLGVEL